MIPGGKTAAVGGLPAGRCCGQWNQVNSVRRQKLLWVKRGLRAGHLLLPVQPLFWACHVALANHSASLCQLSLLWKAALMQFSCHADELTAQTNLGVIDCRLKELVTNINWLIQQFRS